MNKQQRSLLDQAETVLGEGASAEQLANYVAQKSGKPESYEDIMSEILEDHEQARKAIESIIDYYAYDEFKNICETLSEQIGDNQELENELEKLQDENDYDGICDLWNKVCPDTRHVFVDICILSNFFKV